ncbi:hypothetical protein GCN74_03395 [Janthinobacterium sp. FT14W]|uniref:hypothetical protein n=1 Tax=Janthinobacterium sp. FT14W TaxID=2654253 RepID=UPI001265A07E|nr:hypothetical protein [Janthinobacterium sp. FT14W]KAB8062086.1 hypothetical protein GCN74_03395 [Janthinobacterium sp. FT14W]
MLDSASDDVHTFHFDAPSYGGCRVLASRDGDEVQTEIQYIKYETVAVQIRIIKIGPKAGRSGTWHMEYAVRVAIALFLKPGLEVSIKDDKVIAKSVAPWQGDIT